MQKQTFTRVHRLVHRAVMHSADDELGAIDIFALNKLNSEGEATLLISATERQRIDTEQMEDAFQDMLKDTMASVLTSQVMLLHLL